MEWLEKENGMIVGVKKDILFLYFFNTFLTILISLKECRK